MSKRRQELVATAFPIVSIGFKGAIASVGPVSEEFSGQDCRLVPWRTWKHAVECVNEIDGAREAFQSESELLHRLKDAAETVALRLWETGANQPAEVRRLLDVIQEVKNRVYSPGEKR